MTNTLMKIAAQSSLIIKKNPEKFHMHEHKDGNEKKMKKTTVVWAQNW